MAENFKHDSRLHFVLGDIRDPDCLHRVLPGFDVVFHVAALKHVDTGESNPEEFIKTNILGTIHVADAAIRAGIKNVVFSSTDKAVDPANLYGCTKLISEKILFQRNKRQTQTRFSVFRWGNVAASNGSAIPAFVRSISSTGTYELTHPDMTRFWIRIEDAVHFMLEQYKNAPIDRVMIPQIKSAKVTEVASVIAEILRKDEPFPIKIGLRPGEKIHELLSSVHTALRPISSEDCTFTRLDLKLFLEPIVKGLM